MREAQSTSREARDFKQEALKIILNVTARNQAFLTHNSAGNMREAQSTSREAHDFKQEALKIILNVIERNQAF